ncbi:hypothetical protein FGG08_002528 [Glutinoglossum americanum]|uniref:Rhodanese domain-containing protein n=1 Tax=Glutinoglossum americanum TaxID=1670608 RepID=A0A9P8L1J4_9PEZI|nr:hypothetical protein FGG08_002528 [Glutinoglossum americanum]
MLSGLRSSIGALSILSMGTRGSPQLLRRGFSSYLVTPKELSVALSKNPPTKISTSPRTIPLCAAWFMPNDPHQRTGFSAFQTKRIPTARFFDLDAIKDHDSPYPHMLPTAETFAKAMGKLGIRRDDDVVVYDTSDLGVFSAPRVYWTLKVFGHDKVFLLNNFKSWVEQGFPTETGDTRKLENTHYPIPELDGNRVVSFEEVKNIAKDFGKEGAEGVQILDARPYGRWTGKDHEPRKGLSSGHIPGSISLPFSELLDPITKSLLPKQELRKIFEAKGVDQGKPIICTCGTGVTAAVIDAALDEAEFGDPGKRRLYDGSWTEWAQRATKSTIYFTKISTTYLISLPLPFRLSRKEELKWFMESVVEQTPLTQRLAIARLRYNVHELQSKVDQNRTLKPPTRKILNCFVDETALTDGISDIKAWVADHAITITVPLCTLDRLDDLKKGSAQVNVNAREAIRFFDRAQSGRGKPPVLGVRMQAPTEQYATWADVEKYLAPEYLPSVDEQVLPLVQGLDRMSVARQPELGGLSSVDRPMSSSSSATASSTNSLKGSKAVLSSSTPGYIPQQIGPSEADTTVHSHRRGGSTSAVEVPRPIQPLLNCVLWRMHGESPSSDGLGSFFLVTNDLETLSWAQKFDISVKRLDQLSQAIRREEADYKSRLSLFEKSKSSSKDLNGEADDQPILRSRAPVSPKRDTRPLVGHQEDRSTVHSPSSSRTVISPNSFSRRMEPKCPDLGDDFIPRGLMDPDSFGRRSFILKKPKEDDFILKSGISREASRGKGKLWEP